MFALFLAAVVHDLEVYGPYILYPNEEYTMVVVCNYRSYLKRVPFELVLTPKYGLPILSHKSSSSFVKSSFSEFYTAVSRNIFCPQIVWSF